MIEAQSYLISIKQAELRIRLKKQQIEEMRERLLGTSAPLDKEQVTHTTNVSVMADTVATIVDLQKEVDREASSFALRKQEALQLLYRLNPNSASILIRRYFDDASFVEIGKTMYITTRQAQRKCKTALAEFQVILDEENRQNAG